MQARGKRKRAKMGKKQTPVQRNLAQNEKNKKLKISSTSAKNRWMQNALKKPNPNLVFVRVCARALL